MPMPFQPMQHHYFSKYIYVHTLQPQPGYWLLTLTQSEGMMLIQNILSQIILYELNWTEPILSV